MKLIKFLFAVVAAIAISSCSTTEKFSVYTPQGTKIYTPDAPNSLTGTAEYEGKVKLEIPSDMYCGYLLVQAPDSDIKIPIGLDYKTNRHTGTKAALYTGGVLTSAGVATTIIGCIAMIAAAAQEDEDNTSLFGVVTGAGAGVAAVGAAFGAPAGARLQQTAYDYNFGYVKGQKITIPALSSTLINPNPPKNQPEEKPEEKTTTRRKASSGKDVVPQPTSSKVSASRSDNAKKIEGMYTGTGTLAEGRRVDETYSEISVKIERIDKNQVSVRIIESDEDYFESPLTYEVSKDKRGNYTLKIKNLPEATIQITSKGKLTFNHKKVNIENVIYTLDIIAEKE